MSFNTCKVAQRKKQGWKCAHICKLKLGFNRSGQTNHCKELKHTHATDCCYIYWTRTESFEDTMNRVKLLYLLNDEADESDNDEDQCTLQMFDMEWCWSVLYKAINWQRYT
eukprot:249573_1